MAESKYHITVVLKKYEDKAKEKDGWEKDIEATETYVAGLYNAAELLFRGAPQGMLKIELDGKSLSEKDLCRKYELPINSKDYNSKAKVPDDGKGFVITVAFDDEDINFYSPDEHFLRGLKYGIELFGNFGRDDLKLYIRKVVKDGDVIYDHVDD